MEPTKSPPGWHPDPLHRFELRYFNGQRWTNDVAHNGQRFVEPGDLPGSAAGPTPAPVGWRGPTPPTASPELGRGMAITSFVLGVGAVLVAWLPVVFVLGALAAIVAFVLGVVVITRARRNAAGGRGFAVAGTALSVVALGLCVVGFLFTRVVLREVDQFLKPGPYEAVVDRCVNDDGLATLEGHIINKDDTSHAYGITVEFRLDGRLLDSKTTNVPVVAPGDSASFQVVASGYIGPASTGPASTGTGSTGAGSGGLQCTIRTVNGPPPFGF